MARKKTILTEDLFNANGNTEVSGEVLNESVTTDEKSNDSEEKDDSKEILENVENDITDLVENKECEVIEESPIIDEIETTSEGDKTTLDAEPDVENIINTVNKKVGFNDESYYFGDFN